MHKATYRFFSAVLLVFCVDVQQVRAQDEELSWIAVPITVDLPSLTKKLNQIVPERFGFEQQGDFTILKDEVLTVNLKRSPINFQFTGPNRVAANTTIQLERLNLRGNIKVKIPPIIGPTITQGVSIGSRDMSASLKAEASWKMNPASWAPELVDARVSATVRRAFIQGSIAGIRINISCKGLIQEKLNGVTANLTNKLKTALKRELARVGFKDQVNRVSSKLQQGIQIAKKPPLFVRIVPVGAYHTPWQQQGNKAVALAALKCRIYTVASDQKPADWSRITPLPDLQELDPSQIKNHFELHVPVVVDPKTTKTVLNELLTKQHTLKLPDGEVTVKKIVSLSPGADNSLKIEVQNVSIRSKAFYLQIPSATVNVQIGYDKTAKRLIALPSQNAKGTINGLLGTYIGTTLLEHLNKRLATETANAVRSLNQHAQALLRQLKAHNVELSASGIELVELNLTKEGNLRFVGVVRGSAKLTLAP